MHKRFLLLFFTLILSVPLFAQLEVQDGSFIETNGIYPLPEEIKNEIVTRRRWPEEDRKTLISFLENYQAAYINKNLHYIHMVFEDNTMSLDDYKQFSSTHKQEFIKRYEQYGKGSDTIRFIMSEPYFTKGGHYYSLQFKQKYTTKSFEDEIYTFIFIYLDDDSQRIVVSDMNPVKEKLMNPTDVRFQ